ncbi:MAG: hypothetical protein ABW161_15770, partial [Candidatus Thiodiazotropha sp.]
MPEMNPMAVENSNTPEGFDEWTEEQAIALASEENIELTRMFHPFLNLAGDMAKLGWFALTGNQTSI